MGYNPDLKSSTLLNAIKASASDVYKDRIPTATQDNLAEVGSAILSYPTTRNEFVSAMLNRIGKVIITSKLFENPLREFKKGMQEWGKDIEEVFVDLIKSQIFDPSIAESELYKRNMPNISAVFHTLNRQEFYKTTVQETALKQAFVSEEGFSTLIEKIIEKLYTSDNFDEFNIMKHVVYQWGIEGKFTMVEIPSVTNEATAKEAMAIIKEVSNNLTFMSPNYNYAGVHTHTLKEDQIVLINTKFDALVDVEVFASAFNMDKADFIGRRVLVDDFGGLANVGCAVVDRNWFMIYDNLIRTEDVYNAQGLYYNYLLHHWQTISASPFANTVLFVSVEPNLTAINLLPATATVAKGGALQFHTEAVGTGYPSSKVVYTHDGTDTVISTTGLMLVGKAETKETITVTATSVVDPLIVDTATITVV